MLMRLGEATSLASSASATKRATPSLAITIVAAVSLASAAVATSLTTSTEGAVRDGVETPVGGVV